MINVLLVDDHELVRTGIAQLLAKHEAITVIGVAASGEEAIKLVDKLNPDVVLMDINMPGIGGIEASHIINNKHANVKVMALSALSDGPIPQQLMIDGLHGFVSKSSSITELINAIIAVHDGKRVLSADVANGLALSHLQGKLSCSPFERLTKRELQIVIFTLQGKDVAEIAELLKISPKTVCTYRYRLYAKLGIKNDVGLVRLSIKYNLDTDKV